MRNVHVGDIGISIIHGKELFRQSGFHQEYERSHNETNVRHIRKIGVRTRWNLWSENHWLGRLFEEIFIFGWWWTGHQSLAHKRSTYSQILYCVLVRYTRTPNHTLHGKIDWRGSKVHWNTETGTELTTSQWNSSWIFSQDSTRCSSINKSKVSLLRFKPRHHRISQEGFSSCRCSQWHLLGIKRHWKRMRVKCQSRFSICNKFWNRTVVISWSLFRKKGILPVQIVHKVNGTESQRKWC